MTARTDARLAYLSTLLSRTRILCARARRTLETRPCHAPRPTP